MKKILLLVSLALVFSTPSFGQELNKVIDKVSSGVEKVYSDGTALVNKANDVGKVLTPKLESALNILGSELKVGANQVWNILVKQQLVWSFCILILTLLTIFSWFHFWYRINQYHLNNDKDSYVSACVITCIVALAGTIVSGIHFSMMLTGFINPEYGAMETIATIASQIK